MAETTANQNGEIPIDYKSAIESGLKEIEDRLKNIRNNQEETARLKTETREIAKRVDDLLRAM